MLIVTLLAAAVMAPQPIKAYSWITPDDYPKSAYQQSRSGVTAFALTVSADGRSLKCDISTSSGWPDLDAQTCQLLMKRARFKPARDESDAPVLGVYRNFNQWWVGESGSPPSLPVFADLDLTIARMPEGIASPAVVSLALAVSAEGEVSACSPIGPVEGMERAAKAAAQLNADKLGNAACAQATLRVKPKPAIDAAGTPVASIQTARILFQTQP